MIKLGNILHCEPLINHKPLEYINYGMYDIDGDPLFFFNALPTLRIGWKATKKATELNLDILNKNFNDKVRWEFSPTEHIIQYTEGLEKFIKELPTRFIEQYKYTNIDPIFHKIYKLEDFNNVIPKHGATGLYVYKNDMAYYLSIDHILGIKLSAFEYFGISSTDIIEMLKSKIDDRYLLDDSTEYQKYYRILPDFPLLKRSMVVFLFSEYL